MDVLATIKKLALLPNETQWVEFKENNADPQQIGEYISALANSAALEKKPQGYLIWGVKDATHELVGTKFHPNRERIKDQELEHWLTIRLTPSIHFRIHEAEEDGKRFVIFEIPPASRAPVRFGDWEYIRVGSYKKKLKDHPEMARSLWSVLNLVDFESGVALPDVDADQAIELLDCPNFFRLMGHPFPDHRDGILERLAQELLIREVDKNRYHITNNGAILFARDLKPFARLARKALRIIIYGGDNRHETRNVRERLIPMGYAVGFEEAIRYINDQLPQNEQIGQALRVNIRMYPELAIRELVANALIHQDFHITGSGPTVEIFSGRMEITNPGLPLIDTLRFIDEPPRSRNEELASIMRRANICEERGSGIDKVIGAVESFQLPAPDFRKTEGSTVAILLEPRGFSQMDREDRIRACYQHACLWYVSGKRMTNATLRKRLGLEDSKYPMASRVIRDAIDMKLVKPHVQGSESKRDASYLPFWA